MKLNILVSYSVEVKKAGAIPPVPIRLCKLCLSAEGSKNFTSLINCRLYVTLLNVLINRWALDRTRLSRMQNTSDNPDNATTAH
jgi:hypothetical protein